MCSFIAYNKPREEELLHAANRYTVRRGPDVTNALSVEGWTLLHNLLSITGSVTPQPFLDETKRLACLFNGEIYNWESFQVPGAGSDGEILLSLYSQYGADCFSKLDGEFAIVLFDFAKGIVLLATDPFATKPLWYGQESDHFGVATYESAVKSLGIREPKKVPANTVRIIAPITGAVVEEKVVRPFDPGKQHKESVDDFLNAFSRAIQKRAGGVREKVFIGLSSGYDSGAIACELERQHLSFKAFTIPGKENQAVLAARRARLPREATAVINAGYRQYQNEKKELSQRCEQFIASLNSERYEPKNILEDAGAIGLGIICKEAKREGYKIYLSGQGADEILSDYRMHGRGLTGHSSISGAFPEDLAAEFPWHNFYDGAQKFYIAKEEHVAGAYGIEARYPFLDGDVVQEFLYLSPAVKNAAYKYPLTVLFEREQYPYDKDVKIGFVPRGKTLVDYIARLVSALLGRHV